MITIGAKKHKKIVYFLHNYSGGGGGGDGTDKREP